MNVAWCCAILLSFAARSRKSYWGGCIQAAIVICQQIFEISALLIFLLKILSKKCFKIVFFLLWRRDPVLELLLPTLLRVVLLQVLCNSVSADCIVMAASRLLCAA